MMSTFQDSLDKAHEAGKTVIAVGPTDTGKSTWIQQVASSFPDSQISIISGDLGQAIFGAPGLLSAGYYNNTIHPPSRITPARMYFIGENNPFGRFLQTIHGLTLLKTWCVENANRVLIDTDGVVAGPAAREYKRMLLSNLAPADVFFFGDDPTLHPLTDWCNQMSELTCHQVEVPDQAELKTMTGRTQNRNRMLRAWFSNNEIYRVPLREAVVHSSATALGQPVPEDEFLRISEILQTDVLYAEKSNSWLNVLLARQADRPETFDLFNEYKQQVNLQLFEKWKHHLIGDFGPDGFSSGMGYVSSYELNPPRLVIKGNFRREPSDIWVLGRDKYAGR